MLKINAKNQSTLIFLFFLTLVVASWVHAKPVTAIWSNVPPAPAQQKANFLALGDNQLAYRQNTFMLQNLGYGLATDISLKKYDYERLKEWFFLQDALDHTSDAIPMLAAYYYGGVSDKDKIAHIVEYLAHVGESPIKEKWRWLARAVFLARYEMDDLDKALSLSYELAGNKNPNIADWAQQMPAFILAEQGEDKAAYQIMLNILASRYDKLHPAEVNYMYDYMCNTLLPKIPAEPRPSFCDSIKN